MTKVLKFLRQVFHQVYILLGTVLFTIVIIPIFLFVCVPIYCFRYALKLCAPILRPDLGKILCTRSTVAALDDLYTQPKCTLLTAATVEGDVDLDDACHKAMTKVISLKDPKGQLVYPELRQFYESWCGFLFWKWDDSFEIKDHIRIHEPSLSKPMNELDVGLLRLELIRTPYPRNKSPWEIIIVKNFCPTENDKISETGENNNQTKNFKSVVIVKVHHGIADGYSLLSLFLQCSSGIEWDKLAKPQYAKRSHLQIMWHWVKTVILIPYHVVRQRIDCQDDNFLHPPTAKLIRKPYVAADRVSMRAIKEIRNHHKVSFTSVLLASVAGGLRSFLLSNGMAIPKKLHVVIPLPWPGHPMKKVRNFWTFCAVNLPLNISGSHERLQRLQREWESMKKSTIPTMNFMLVPLVGAMPTEIIKYFARCRFSTMVMSNFPGPPAKGDFLGYRIIDASFGGGLGRGSLGCGMALLSFDDTLRISLGVDQAILPSHLKVQELMSYIKKELNNLGQDVIV